MKKLKNSRNYPAPPNSNQIITEIDLLLQKRAGGSINFRGVHYQVIYACYLLLAELKENSSSKSIRMEGIEDVDVYSSKIISSGDEYIQLKSSINKMDAGTFWSLGVLQNFMEAYLIEPNSKFKLVYNMKIADGNLSSLINNKTLSTYWIVKINSIYPNIDYNDFISKISFEPRSVNELYSNLLILLYKEWNINKGTENQFIRSLFYNVLIWSRDRATISHADIAVLFQDITDSYSKAPINVAIQNNWITKIDFQVGIHTNLEDYYDGKAARPGHISSGLPARRKNWEKEIQKSVDKSEVTVIKSSSGQGKSTMAWQVAFNRRNNLSVYQLHTCKDSDEANSVAEFLESRCLIGEMPLVIVDGLSSSVSSWPEIVQKTKDRPVKYIITSRQEDWYRFGADISRINLSTVEISLSMPEAKDIFEQFKKKGKIHATIVEWQPVWEQIHRTGLLIEYTYLLTKGEMIYERLSSQLKYLSSSRSSTAKMEILRLASLADCLNIKLSTASLFKHIKIEIGFDQDRGEILNELEKEYFINFDNQFISGLHPVRSHHMKDILHQNLPISDSLINLYKIIDENYKHDFFINTPLLLTPSSKSVFYYNLAEQLFDGKFSDMVFALDGVMHGEPQRYWNSNKMQFDKAYDTGGIELFSTATIPFVKLDTLDELANIMGENGGDFKYLSNLKKELQEYTFENTDLVLFGSSLSTKLMKRTAPIDSYEGLEFIVRWFNILKLPYNFPSLNNNILIDDLTKMDIKESKELMLYFQISQPLEYKNFISKHKDQIISYLKVCTNSLTIQEVGRDIQINYLLFDNEVNKANEFSVFRIQTLYAFFPYYEKYCTEAILLPFPSEEIISVVRQNSVKHLTANAIGSMFDVHLNQIWTATIERNYHETSAYSWQKNILKIRNVAIDWAKIVVRLTDSLLEGNEIKKKSSSEALGKIRLQLSTELTLRKAYPQYEKKYFEKKILRNEEKEVNTWLGSLGNINGQLLNIFIPKKDHDRTVALINLKAVYLDLKKMQEAYTKIENTTISYFSSDIVSTEENKYFERLYTTILYYCSQIPFENKKAVAVARKTVEDWWLFSKHAKLKQLSEILNMLQDLSAYKFLLPTHLEETETLTYISFGILDFNFSNQDDFFNLSMDLAPLAQLSCDFITIISITNGTVNGGLRFKREYFEVFEKYVNGENDIDIEGLTPLPINFDEKLLMTLPNVTMPEVSARNQEKEIEIKILYDLWKLSEFRARLNKESIIENKWLQDIEQEYVANNKKALLRLMNATDELTKFVNEGLTPNKIYSKEEIVKQLFKSIQVQN